MLSILHQTRLGPVLLTFLLLASMNTSAQTTEPGAGGTSESDEHTSIQSGSAGTLERVMRYLDQAQYIEPSRGVGAVTLGMTFAQVARAWGKPDHIDRTGLLRKRTIYTYKTDLGSYLKVEGRRSVDSIGIEGHSDFATREGVRFGTPHHQVQVIYGQTKVIEGRLNYPRRGIEFALKDGAVFQIRVFPARL